MDRCANPSRIFIGTRREKMRSCRWVHGQVGQGTLYAPGDTLSPRPRRRPLPFMDHLSSPCGLEDGDCLCGSNLLALLVLQSGLLDVFSDLLDGLIVGLVTVLGAGRGISVGRRRFGGTGRGLLNILVLGLLGLDLLDLFLGLLNVLYKKVSERVRAFRPDTN